MEYESRPFSSNVKRYFKRFNSFPPYKKLAAIFFILLALPVGVYLVRTFSLTNSRAANVQLSFSPSSLTVPGNQRLSVLVNSGSNKVAFSRIHVRFDRAKVQMVDEVQLAAVGTVPSLAGKVTVTSKSEANTNGEVVIVVVPCGDGQATSPSCSLVDSNTILPSGTFQVASLAFAPVSGQTGTTTVSFTTSDTQIVDNTPDTPIVFTPSGTSATLTLGSSTACGTKSGDTNNDNSIDILDIGNVVRAYGSNPVSNPCADLDHTGSVDILDIGYVVRNYGN